MKRRGLTRVVALATVVTMMSAELSAYATENVDTAAGTSTEATAESDEAVTTDLSDGDAKAVTDETTGTVEMKGLNTIMKQSARVIRILSILANRLCILQKMFLMQNQVQPLLVTDKKETHDYGASAVELGLNDEGAVDESGNAASG